MEPTNPITTVRAELQQIVDYFAELAELRKTQLWQTIAEKLSASVQQQPPWSWRYPQGVLQGTIAPSAAFARAVHVLGASLDDVPLAIANTEAVQVIARPGAVQAGSLVMGASRICASPTCRVRFVPDHPRRKYCPVCHPPKERS